MVVNSVIVGPPSSQRKIDILIPSLSLCIRMLVVLPAVSLQLLPTLAPPSCARSASRVFVPPRRSSARSRLSLSRRPGPTEN